MRFFLKQEKMRGQRGRLPVQPLEYVMSTKVILDERKSLFQRKSVFRDVRMQANLGLMFERKAEISRIGGQSGLDVCRWKRLWETRKMVFLVW